MSILSLLAHPLYQAALVSFILVITSLVYRFDTKYILGYGFYCFSAWMLTGLVYNFMVENYWAYLWQSALAYVSCTALLILLAYIGESVFKKNGEMAWVGLIGLMNIFAITILVAAIENLFR